MKEWVAIECRPCMFRNLDVLSCHHIISICLVENLQKLYILAITYKVQITLGKQMGAATSGHTWINVAGTLSSTGKIDTPKGQLEFRFKVRPLPMGKFYSHSIV